MNTRSHKNKRLLHAPAAPFTFGSLAVLFWLTLASAAMGWQSAEENLTEDQWAAIRRLEQQRIKVIDQVMGSVIAIYGDDREGGGSGVIIDPSGIALTNHHVIMGAGVTGWGGLADGKMYRWELVGSDPGGDVAVIQMMGRDDFPYSPLGDSDRVSVGDWALAMGNPFLLTEDQKPTVTLGIVSGVRRFQPGAGAHQLVYGNCIQVDSSINPGNSGGPLFDMNGRVIGINGRGSFEERGRVNVGLGYAISSNQIKNFLPELLATKLVEHGTLDASFGDRGGKVVCENLFEDTPLYKAGVRPGDVLLEFERQPIRTANQFTNLICTLPEKWPACLKLQQADGSIREFHTRLFGLPYPRPQQRPELPKGRKPTPEEKQQFDQAMAMYELLAAPPGTIRNVQTNRKYARHVLARSRRGAPESEWAHIAARGERDGENIALSLWANPPFSRWQLTARQGDSETTIGFDSAGFYRVTVDGRQDLRILDAKLDPWFMAAAMVAIANQPDCVESFGQILLDGADKAGQKNAWRMKLTDDLDDPFYVWFNMYDDRSNEDIFVRKLGPSLNLDDERGGVSVPNWNTDHGWQIPERLDWIVGLAERTTGHLAEWEVQPVSAEDLPFEVSERKP